MNSTTKRAVVVNQPSIHQQVDFETWLNEFKRSLRTQKKVKETFTRWFESKYCGENRTEPNKREFAQRIYRKTSRAFTSKTVKQQHADARRQIERLLDALRSTIGAVDSVRGRVESRDGKAYIRGSFFIPKLTELEQMTAALVDDKHGILNRKHMHKPTVLIYCLPLLLELDSCGVSERDQVDLFRMIMECHGASQDQLNIFSDAAIENRTIFKAKKAFRSRVHIAH